MPERGGRREPIAPRRIAHAAALWPRPDVSVREIVARTSISRSKLYVLAKRRRWGLRPTRPQPEVPLPALPSLAPRGQTPLRRCQACEQLTRRAPCSVCGAEWETS